MRRSSHVALLLAASALLLVAQPVAAVAAPADPAALPAAPAPDLGDTTRVTLTTSLGDLVLELDYRNAPITVANFLRYARDGHYEGTIFHRVIKNFMAQGGGFDASGKQKPTRASIPNEATNGLKNVYGSVAMARTNLVDSATAQFFINAKDNANLDHRDTSDTGFGYCVFGKLVGGVEVLEALRAVPVENNPRFGSEKASPVTQVLIQKVTFADAKQAEAMAASLESVTAALAEARKAKEAGAFQEGIDLVAAKEHDVSKGQLLPSGLWVLDVTLGSGEMPAPTQTVSVHYTGWLTNGTKFDSSRDRGKPAEFPLNGVISGWTEGVGGMRPGGRRMLVIPFAMAYGEAGRPPTIPARAPLVFDVELLKIVR